MKILAIETSCDETACAIIDDNKNIISNQIFSQIEDHMPYGGVVPEIAARAHYDKLDIIIKKAMSEANIHDFKQLDAIAVTCGPGLIGGVIVGVMMAKSIASVAKLPIIGVNHLEGHALSIRLSNDVEYPFLLLLLSGGHCQILVVSGVGKYELLGATLDDSLGEAFDKVAKSMSLPYPGGPIIEKLAKSGDEKYYKFPKPLYGTKGCNFSFSGLKTAVKRQIDEIDNITDIDRSNISASFQYCVTNILTDRLKNALEICKDKYPQIKDVVLAGGVAANKYIGGDLSKYTQKHGYNLMAPPMKLCTDNAAMIGWAGIERYKLNLFDDLYLAPKARMPLV